MHLSVTFTVLLAATSTALISFEDMVPSIHRVCSPNELGLEDYYGFVVHHQVTMSAWPLLHHTRISECKNSYVQQHDQYSPNEAERDIAWGKKMCSMHNSPHTRCFMMARRRRYAGLKYSLFVPNMWIGTLFECDWRNPKESECIDPVPIKPLMSDNLVLANWYETPDSFKHIVRRIPMLYTTNTNYPLPRQWDTKVDPWERYKYDSLQISLFQAVSNNLQSWFHTLNHIGQQTPLDIDIGDNHPRRGYSEPLDLSYKEAFECWDNQQQIFYRCSKPEWRKKLEAERHESPDKQNEKVLPPPVSTEPTKSPNDFDEPVSRLLKAIFPSLKKGRTEESQNVRASFETEREKWREHNAKLPENSWSVLDFVSSKPSEALTGLADKILFEKLGPGGPALKPPERLLIANKMRAEKKAREEYEEYRRSFGEGFEEVASTGQEFTHFSSLAEHNQKAFAKKDQRQQELEKMKVASAFQKRNFNETPTEVTVTYAIPTLNDTFIPSADDLKTPIRLQTRSPGSRLELTLAEMIGSLEAIGERKYRQLMENIFVALDGIETEEQKEKPT